MPARPFLAAAPVIAVLVALTGCTGTPAESSTSSAPTTTKATGKPSPTPTDEAAVLAAYRAYWDAVVQAEQGNPDRQLFAGVAEGQVVEEEIATAQQYRDLGIVREGAPTFSKETVTVDGDTATVLACVDNSDWGVSGVTADPSVPQVLPGGVVLRRTETGWIVTGTQAAPADLTC